MADPDKNDEAQGFSDSDQAWFDRLSGKPVSAEHAGAMREADALRRALTAERSAADAQAGAEDSAEEQERQWQRLQFRLRREGLLDKAAPSRRRFWPAAAAMAATVVLAVLVFPRGGHDADFDEPPTPKGDFFEVKRQDAEPRKAAAALAANLAAAGLRPRQYQRGRTFIVDVELLPDADDAARAAFGQAGLEARPGITRVEFEPR